MAVITYVSRRYDFKYQAAIWRADVAESFQKTKQTRTDYTVVDGQVVKTVETTREFADAVAAVSPQFVPEPPATFLFFDKTYRKDSAYTFQKTHIKTTTFEAYGNDAYLVTIDDYNVLTGTTTRTVSIVDGKIPLAPTINSALTNLINRPILNTLEDNCDSIDSRTDIGNAWLEDTSDAAKATKRKLQRETAIVRRVKHAANPLMKLGHTIRLVAPKRGLDARHILVQRTITTDENGAADEALSMEFWTR
jgi:hypothetical protein